MSLATIERVSAKSPAEYYHQMVRIHKEEIHEGFLTSLGSGFLLKLYGCLAASSKAVVFVAVRDGQVVGFICGSINTSEVYREFIGRSGFAAGILLVPRLLSLSVFRKVIETLLYPARASNQELPHSEILSFCVGRANQRQGIGKRLFCVLIDELRNHGVEQVKIVTGSSQIEAQQFYGSIGARRVAEIEVHKGSNSLVFVYDTR